MNALQPKDFPTTVKEIAKTSSNGKEIKQRIKALVVSSESVRQAFEAWAKDNTRLVEKSPLWKKIQNRKNSDTHIKSLNKELITFGVDQLKRGLNPLKKKSDASKMETIIFNKQITEWKSFLKETDKLGDCFLLLASHAGLEILTDGEAVQFFEALLTQINTQDFVGVKLLLHGLDEAVLKESLPFLKQLPASCKGLLSKRSANSGRAVLQDPHVGSKALLLLEALNDEMVVKLFTERDEHGNTLVGDVSVLKPALPRLETVEPQQLIELFLTKDHADNFPLHYDHVFKAALPLLKKLEPKSLEKIFSLKNKKGEIPLHTITYTNEVESLLGTELLKKLSVIKNNKGQTSEDYKNKNREYLEDFVP